MLPICIATLPPVSWLAVEAPPPALLLLPLLLLSLPSSSCAHLLERRCRCCLCASVCVPAGLFSQVLLLLSLGLIESRYLWMGNGCATWHNLQVQSRRLPRTAAAVRHMQMRLGFNYGLISLDIIWNPRRRNGREPQNIFVFWSGSLCTGSVNLFLSWLFFFFLSCIFWEYWEFLMEKMFLILWGLNKRKKRKIKGIGAIWDCCLRLL